MRSFFEVPNNNNSTSRLLCRKKCEEWNLSKVGILYTTQTGSGHAITFEHRARTPEAEEAWWFLDWQTRQVIDPDPTAPTVHHRNSACLSIEARRSTGSFRITSLSGLQLNAVLIRHNCLRDCLTDLRTFLPVTSMYSSYIRRTRPHSSLKTRPRSVSNVILYSSHLLRWVGRIYPLRRGRSDQKPPVPRLDISNVPYKMTSKDRSVSVHPARGFLVIRLLAGFSAGFLEEV